MKRNILTRLTLGLTLFLSLVENAQAFDWLVLNPLNISLITRFHAELSEPEDEGAKYTYRRVLEAGINFDQKGYVIDPNIARFSINLEPNYTFGALSGTDRDGSVDDTNINYDVSIYLLQNTALPISSILRARRSLDINYQSFGSYTRYGMEEWWAQFSWKNLYFPTSLEYTERSLLGVFISGTSDNIIQRDELSRTFLLEAKSTPTRLRLEVYEVDDRIETRNNDFIRIDGSLSHALYWGKGSWLFSSLRYFDRDSRDSSTEQTSIQESAHILHKENLFSNIVFLLNSNTKPAKATYKSFNYKLEHSIYRNIRNSASFRYFSNKNLNSKQADNQINLNSQYQKSNLFGVGVGAYAGVLFGNSSIDSTSGLIKVVDEAHVISISGDVLLNRRYAILASVVVTDNTGAIIYIEGIDYQLRSEPEGFTRILIIPGGRLTEGDPILVSYSAVVLPSSEYSTLGINGSFTISYYGFQFSHYTNRIDYTLNSGSSDRFLSDLSDSTTRLSYQHKFTQADLTFDLEYRNYETGFFKTENLSSRQTFSYALSQRTRMRLNLRQSKVDSSGGNVEKTYDARLLVEWRTMSGLMLEPVVEIQRRNHQYVNNGLTTNTKLDYFTAGINVRWMYRLISLNLNYRYFQSKTNTNDTYHQNVYFYLTRRIR